MVDGFTESFVNRFQGMTNNNLIIVNDNQTFESDNVYICEAETKLVKNTFNKRPTSANSYNPNINILFNSFTTLAKDIEILCVILTGIGDDGVEACKNLSLNGSRCITESEKSAIVDGMPSRARLLVPNIEVNDIETIVKKIKEFCE